MTDRPGVKRVGDRPTTTRDDDARRRRRETTNEGRNEGRNGGEILKADYGEYDYNYDYTGGGQYPADKHDISTFGPPRLWVRTTSSSGGSNGSDGADGADGSKGEVPDWVIALAAVAFATSIVTAIVVLIHRLCCAKPRGVVFATHQV